MEGLKSDITTREITTLIKYQSNSDIGKQSIKLGCINSRNIHNI